MAQADDDAQAEADQLVDAAGRGPPADRRSPWACCPGGDVRAVMQVEDADDAAGDAETRAGWPRGRRPGRAASSPTGSRWTRAGSTGREVVLDLRPVEGSYVLSDLTSGPVLFADLLSGVAAQSVLRLARG